MREPITLPEMVEQIRVMHLVVPKYGLGQENISALATAYRDVIRPYDSEAVQGGGALWRKFPRVRKQWAKRCPQFSGPCGCQHGNRAEQQGGGNRADGAFQRRDPRALGRRYRMQNRLDGIPNTSDLTH